MKNKLQQYIEIDYLKPLNTDIYYVQQWFTKASWNQKLDFCTKLFNVIKDGDHVTEMVYFIGSPGKDLTYTREQYSKTSYDIRPMDHSRSLSDEFLEKIKVNYLNWFKSLENHHQFKVLMGLLNIGGSALQERIYNLGAKVLTEREEELALQLDREKKLQEHRMLLDRMEKLALARKAKKNARKRKNSIAKKPSTHKKESVLSSKTSIYSNINLMNLIKSGKLNYVFLGPKTDENAQAELQKLQLQWKKFLAKVEITPLKDQHLSYSDKIQMLPIWVNRKIIHRLPESSYPSLTKVNGYWKDMITHVKKEKRVRRLINFAITSVKASAPLYGAKFGIEKPKTLAAKIEKAKESKSAQPNKQGHDPRKKKKSKSAKADVRLSPEVELDRSKISDYFNGFKNKNKFLFQRHTISIINNEFVLFRVGVASPRWIIYSLDNNLKFHCTATGAPSTFEIEHCHNEPITCLSMHSNNYQVFTGSSDGKIKLFDIWSKECKLTYLGHNQIITSIASNDTYIVSVASNSFLKVFRIYNALCILTLQLQEGMPTKVCLGEESSIYAGNINGKLLMIKFTDLGTGVLQKNIKYGIIHHAHFGEITHISTYPLLVITSGVDGYVRIWDADMTEPHWIGSFKHETRVNSAVVSFLKLFTACEDGCLFIWDIEKSVVLKRIAINHSGRPIISLTCLEEHCFVKLVIFSELDIKFLELELPWRKHECRQSFTHAKTIARSKRIKEMEEKFTKADLDVIRLHYRKAISEELRNLTLNRRPEEQKPTVYSYSAPEIDEIKSFPRIYKRETSGKTKVEKIFKPEVIAKRLSAKK